MKDGSILDGLWFLLCILGFGIFGLGFCVGYLVFGL
jgi:hypothetical protein